MVGAGKSIGKRSLLCMAVIKGLCVQVKLNSPLSSNLNLNENNELKFFFDINHIKTLYVSGASQHDAMPL